MMFWFGLLLGFAVGCFSTVKFAGYCVGTALIKLQERGILRIEVKE